MEKALNIIINIRSYLFFQNDISFAPICASKKYADIDYDLWSDPRPSRGCACLMRSFPKVYIQIKNLRVRVYAPIGLQPAHWLQILSTQATILKIVKSMVNDIFLLREIALLQLLSFYVCTTSSLFCLT